MEIYVDGDACPVKDEVMKVAYRHKVCVHFVANSWMRLDNDPLVNRVVVQDRPDAADDWIVEHIQPDDIAVTADIPLRQVVHSRQYRHGQCDARIIIPLARDWRKQRL
jgi:uncharacterized protein YaiI (UPF0178 family)